MNIRLKLTLLFTLIVSLIVVIMSFTVYFSYEDFRKEEFYDRLKNKANITSRLLLGMKEVDHKLLRLIDENNLDELYSEKVWIYNDRYELLYSNMVDQPVSVTRELLEQIKEEGAIEFSEDEKEVIGLRYQDPTHKFLVLVAAHDKFGRLKLNNLRLTLLLSCLMAILLSGLGAFFYVKQALQPIEHINHEIKRITARNLDKRLGTGNGKDEIARLAMNFNLLLNRIQRSVESQRSFVQHASHELRTPLSSITSQIEVTLGQERPAAEYKALLESLLEDTEHLTSLTNTLLSLNQYETYENQQPFHLLRMDELVFSASDSLQHMSPGYHIQVDFRHIPEKETDLLVMGDEMMLEIAIKNLMDNACKFSDNSSAQVYIDFDLDSVLITVKDKGPGISEHDSDHIFDPFYRSEATRQKRGFGLGLSLCQRIVQRHGGKILLQSQIGQGTTFTLQLPAVKEDFLRKS